MINAANIVSQLNIEARLRRVFDWLSDVERLPKLQRLLLLVLVVWAVNSLVNVTLAFSPKDSAVTALTVAINPASTLSAQSRSAEVVDVSSILGADVFGPVTKSEVESLSNELATVNPRDGIENGARETRLALKLTGIVASTSDGLGSAMIEAKKKQELYAVGDALPANGKVTLAKILPKQVVIDNNGTYELITLFSDQAIAGIVENVKKQVQQSTLSTQGAGGSNSPVNVAKQQRLASRYRQQLYDDPPVTRGIGIHQCGARRGWPERLSSGARQRRSAILDPGV